jgi:hypothetical protein
MLEGFGCQSSVELRGRILQKELDMSRVHSLRRTVSLFVTCGVICGCNSEPNKTTAPSGERAVSRSNKPGSAASRPAARPERPRTSVERIAIQLVFSSHGESAPTYVLPADELARAWKQANKLVAEEIDVSSMRVLYSERCVVRFGVPSPKTPSDTEPARPRYYKFYLEHGAIRLVEKVEESQSTVAWKIYYDEHGAPALVLQPFGTDHMGSWLEYDEAGYLRRRLRIAFVSKKMIHGVNVFVSTPGYGEVTKYDFEGTKADEPQWLSEKVDYSSQGTVVYNIKDGSRQKYGLKSFVDWITVADAKKFHLATLFPIPSQ